MDKLASLKLARAIAVYSYDEKVKNPFELQVAFGLLPLQFINACSAGEFLNVFTLNRHKDGSGIKSIQVSEEQYQDIAFNRANFGKAVESLADDIFEAVVHANRRENDLTTDLVRLWAGGDTLPLATFHLAIKSLVGEGEIVSYDITDPKDKKSTYTFLTHADNKDKMWGWKQFKSGGKAKS